MNEMDLDLLEEYKLCQQKATSLEGHIFRSATFFGVGSIAGITALLTIAGKVDEIPANLQVIWILIIGLIAVGAWFTWLRLAER